MKKCPTCQTTYADEMNFCLNDGVTLIPFNSSIPNNLPEAETKISVPFQSIPQDNPTVLMESAPQTVSNNTMFETAQTPNSNFSKYVFGGIGCLGVLGILGFGILYGTGLIKFSSGTATNNTEVTKSDSSRNSSDNSQITFNTSNKETPTPNSKETPSPSNKASNVNSNLSNTTSNSQNVAVNTATPKPTPKETPTPDKPKGCVLDDGGKGEGEVRVRQDCDFLDCENDNSTVAGTFPVKTQVQKLGGSVKTANYTWTKIRVGGRVVWVSSSKIRCN